MGTPQLRPWVTEAICPLLGLTSKSVVLDPCCRDGSVLAGIKPIPRMLLGFELNASQPRLRKLEAHVTQRDALSPEEWGRGRITHVVSRPPLRIAIKLATRAMGEVFPTGGSVALLLPLSFLSSDKRSAFHNEHPADLFVLNRRPTIDGRGNKGDYGWFVWHHQAGWRWQVLQLPSAKRGHR